MKHLRRFNENKIGEDYITDFLNDRPEIEILFNKHFKGENINNYTQKIPWKKSPGIEISFGIDIPIHKLNIFGDDFDELSNEKGWDSQWETDEDGNYILFIYESNTDVNESSEHFSLTDKYEELSDDVLLQKTGDDEWLERTPNHIKLLSLLANGIDADIADYFLLDDRFFSALENEYRYVGYRLTRDEVKHACYKLKEEGYLK